MRVRESPDKDRAASMPKPSPTPEGRIWLRDLPVPAEMLPYIEDYCKGCWFWERAKRRRRIEEDLKLQYYFGGHEVYYLATPKGRAVIQVDNVEEGGYHRLRDQLPVEEPDQLRSRPVERWNAEGRLPSSYQGL